MKSVLILLLALVFGQETGWSIPVESFINSCTSFNKLNKHSEHLRNLHRAELSAHRSGLFPQLTTSLSGNEVSGTGEERLKVGVSFLNIDPLRYRDRKKLIKHKNYSLYYQDKMEQLEIEKQVVNYALEYKYRLRLEEEYRANKEFVSLLDNSLNLTSLSNKGIKSYLSKQKIYDHYSENKIRINFLEKFFEDCSKKELVKTLTVKVKAKKRKKSNEAKYFERNCLHQRKMMEVSQDIYSRKINPQLFMNYNRVLPSDDGDSYNEWRLGVNFSFNFGSAPKAVRSIHPCEIKIRAIQLESESEETIASSYLKQYENLNKILARLNRFGKSIRRTKGKVVTLGDDYYKYLENLEATLKKIWAYETFFYSQKI